MVDQILYKNKWLCSYETIRFDTSDGDLDIGQYAVVEGGYLIRTKPKNEAQFEGVNSKYDVSKLTEVKILEGKHCYYDEFLMAKGAEAIWGEEKKEMPSGGIIRIPSTSKKYWDTARIKNHPQPERVEMVSELPPPEPEPTLSEHHSIAFDATSNSGNKTYISSYSWSHTCTGDNRLLVVGDAHIASTDRTITGVTFNGDALTFIRSDMKSYSDSYYRTTLYYMVAPDAGGAYTVTVTLSGILSAVVGGTISYTGAAQTGQPDSSNGATNSELTNLPTVDVTTIADNSWVVSVVYFSATAGTFTSNNTQRWNVDATSGSTGGSDTNGPKTPAGSQTMSWSNFLAGSNWTISAASFAPVAAAGNIKVIAGVTWANVKKVSGVAKASIKKIAGVATS